MRRTRRTRRTSRTSRRTEEDEQEDEEDEQDEQDEQDAEAEAGAEAEAHHGEVVDERPGPRPHIKVVPGVQRAGNHLRTHPACSCRLETP